MILNFYYIDLFIKLIANLFIRYCTTDYLQRPYS